MNRLSYYQPAGITATQIILDCEKHKPNEVVIFGPTEWEIREATLEFVGKLNSLGVELKLIHAAFKNQYYIDRYNSIGLSIDNVTFWGTNLFHWAWRAVIANGNILKNEPNPFDFKYKFISLNNRRHLHRCALIDELAKNNLLDKGVVTWTNFLNENADYSFKYFDGEQRLLNDDFITKLNSFLLPKEWHESFFHVVAEANIECVCISEKTSQPILGKKPFIILGATGFHRQLTDLGFQLFDELIDYSFDEVEDLQTRTELFVSNIEKIIECDPIYWYKRLEPKLIHNYNRLIEIATSAEFVPNIVKEIYDDIYHDHTDRMFRTIHQIVVDTNLKE